MRRQDPFWRRALMFAGEKLRWDWLFCQGYLGSERQKSDEENLHCFRIMMSIYNPGAEL